MARTGAFVVVALFALLGIWQVFSVSKIDVRGTKTLSSDEVVKLVNQSFGHHAFSSNLLTLSLAKLPEELPGNSERIESATVKRAWPNRIIITVTERSAALGWKSGSQTYAVDGKGKVIGLLADIGVQVPIVEDRSNLPVKTGEIVATARFVEFSSKVGDEVTKQTGLKVTSLYINDVPNDLFAVTDRGYYLKLDATRPLAEQTAALRIVLKTFSEQKKTPTQYIDLRIANKAYGL